MDKLPLEILHNIFIELPLTQKQVCMYVCHQWKRIILEHSLLHTVYIDQQHLLTKLLDLVERMPSRKRQVEHVRLFSGLEILSNMTILIETFPKLHTIEIHDLYSTLSGYTNVIYKKKFNIDPTQIKSYIYYLTDDGLCKFTHSLVTCNWLRQLLTLNLRFNNTEKLPVNVSVLLKNITNLKNLSLENLGITIDDCETLHSALPLLESLDLQLSKAIPSLAPEYINPATKVIKFAFYLDDINMPASQNDWIIYIHRKYPNMEQFNFSANTNKFISSIHTFYDSKFSTLLNSIGSQLKALTLCCVDHIGYDLLKNLDSLGCQLNELNIQSYKPSDIFIDSLESSNQINYIEKLSINNIFTSSFDWLKNMKNLKVFEIKGKNWYGNRRGSRIINLYSLFKCLPQTLFSVSIDLCEIDCKGPERPQKFPSIKYLEVKSPHAQYGIDKLISNCFPCLESLILYKSLVFDGTINLSNCHLSYLDINRTTNLSLNILREKKTYYYNINGRQRTNMNDYTILSNEYLPVPLETINCRVFQNITCGSVKTFFINGSPASFILSKHALISFILRLTN